MVRNRQNEMRVELSQECSRERYTGSKGPRAKVLMSTQDQEGASCLGRVEGRVLYRRSEG